MKFSNNFIIANHDMCDFDAFVPAPYFRKEFMLDFQPESAEITICGLGFYELYINGENITKGAMAPYISNTDDVCYYDSYDIKGLIHKGENVIGILLGNGFRNPYGGFVWDFDKAPHRGPVTLALCLEVKNGHRVFELEADESFRTSPSPILYDDIRMGYCYDARKEQAGWNRGGFDDSDWKYALKGQKPKGIIRRCEAEPIVVTNIHKAVSIAKYDELPFAHDKETAELLPFVDSIRKNVYVYDFGINTAGVTRLKVNGKPGQVITIRHGEYPVREHFSVNTTIFQFEDEKRKWNARYRQYGQTDVFICKGGEEVFVPKFKYDGFRYAYVEGLTKEQAVEDAVVCLEMHSDVTERAGFVCSDSILNQLQSCARNSDLSNFYYFPTDCPHREKNGWTGDAAMSAEHMLLNLTVEKSLKEWLFNIQEAQNGEGALPGIVPTGGWGFDWGNGPAWDSVCVNLPFYIYKYTGDKQSIIENTDMMMRYLVYIASRRDEKGLIAIGLGDWVDPCSHERGSIAAPLVVTDSFMVYDIARKAAHLFKECDYLPQSRYALGLAEELYVSIRENLIEEHCTIAGNCQTSQVLGLAMEIFTQEEREEAGKRLLEIIHRDGDVNACGMIGLRYLFHVLTDMGETELAYCIMISKERTCYGYWIEHGATTLWESFRAVDDPKVDSRNHHFLGDISSWFIQKIAGLMPNPEVNDISFFRIKPHFIKSLSYAGAHFETMSGTLRVQWERKDDRLLLSVTGPAGTHGEIDLPEGYVFEDGSRFMIWDGALGDFKVETGVRWDG